MGPLPPQEPSGLERGIVLEPGVPDAGVDKEPPLGDGVNLPDTSNLPELPSAPEVPDASSAPDVPVLPDKSDPPCLQNPSHGRSCYVGRGVCESGGSFVCTKDGLGIECDATPKAPQPEICDNQDNDCDGEIDEGDVCGLCKANTTRLCYTGPNGTQGVGVCKAGVETCQADGTWGQCVGEVLAQKETCNGLDDNCDGTIDEDFPQQGNACQVTGQQGECAKGVLDKCVNGTLVCTQVTNAVTEVCNNGKDDDCDGQTDETPPCVCQNGATRPCGSDVGACQKGTQTCQNNQWGACTGETKPTPEACDGQDNDCNGQTDDNPTGVGVPCTLSNPPPGTCAKGIRACISGTLRCQTGTSTAEVCDGKDNDCNGQIDDNISTNGSACTTTTRKGECAKGVLTCTNGANVCGQFNTVKPEVCDGLDNNCNGRIDDSLQAPLCQLQDGACAENVKRCAGASGWAACTSADYIRQNSLAQPGQETGCDGVDNDCDGQTDEGCNPAATSLLHIKKQPETYGLEILSFAEAPNGDTYAAGYLNGFIDIDGKKLRAPDISRYYIVTRWDKQGKLLWHTSATVPSGDSSALHITSDTQGNVYVTGTFRQMTIGGQVVTASGVDIFVGKIDATGKWVWQTHLGSSKDDAPTAIATDTSGRVYLTGSFDSQLFIGGQKRASGSTFFAILDSKGSWLEVGAIQGNNTHAITGIYPDGTGGFAITGSFLGSVTTGSLTVGSARDWSLFAAFRDSTKKWLWLNHGAATKESQEVASGRDNQGNLYFFGAFEGTARFGTFSLYNASKSTFLAKLDSTGKWQSASELDSAKLKFRRFGVAPSGALFFGGHYTSTHTFGTSIIGTPFGLYQVFFAKMNAAGQWVSANSGATMHSFLQAPFSSSFHVDAKEQVYWFGDTTYPTVGFGTLQLQPAPNQVRHKYIVKLASNNTWAWLSGLPFDLYDGLQSKLYTNLHDTSYQSLKDSQGALYLRGRFREHLYVNNNVPLLTRLENKYSHYIVKFDAQKKLLWARAEPNEVIVSRIVTSANGDTFLHGELPASASATFGSIVVPSGGCSACGVVAMLDKDGKWSWAKRINTLVDEKGRAFFDQQGNIFLFDQKTGNFLRWNKTGQALSTVTSSFADLTMARADAQNNLYLGGKCAATCKLGASQLSLGTNLSVALKTNTALSAITWSFSWVDTSLGLPRHILHDSTGNTYVHLFRYASSNNGYESIHKISPTGTELWVDKRNRQQPDVSTVLGMEWSSKGEILFIGQGAGIMQFGNKGMRLFASQPFVATLNTNGTWTSAQSFTPPYILESHDFYLGPQDELFFFMTLKSKTTVKGTQFYPYSPYGEIFLQLSP